MALSEGMVAVVRSAETPGGLCVTLMEGNRQYTLMPNSDVPLRMQSNPDSYPRKTQSTSTQKPTTIYNEQERHRNVYDSSTQAVDGQYASIYKMAHCNLRPTSPPVELSEFPPQRPGVCPGQENFVIGGCGSRNTNQSPPRNSSNFRVGTNWPAQGAAAPVHRCTRTAHRPDAFAKSLRNYPSLSPERSAEVVERLINYSNMRNNKLSPERQLIPKNHSQCSKCSTPMTECFQQIDSRPLRSPRAEIYDESPTRDRWQCGEDKECLPNRCDVRSMSQEKYKDFQKVISSYPANLCPSIMERLNHIPSKFNNNIPAVNRKHFVNMETQAAVPTVSKEIATLPRPPPEVRNVAVFVSPASTSLCNSDSQHRRLKIIRDSKSISIQTQTTDVLILRGKSAETCFSSVDIRNNKKIGHKRRSKSQVELKIDDDLDEQMVQIIQDLTKPSAHLRNKLKKARKQKHDKHEAKVKIDKCENEKLLLSEINLKEFTRELSNDLLSKIKRQNVIIQPSDLYRANYFDLCKTNYEQCFIDEIVIEWLNDIPIKRTDYLGRPVVKENILETVGDKIHNVLLNKLKYSEASTKADIIDILEDIPIDVTGHTRRYFLNKLVTELTSKVKRCTSKNQWKLPDFCNYVQSTDEEVKQFIENEVTDLQRKFSLLICHDTVGHMINELTAILLDSMEAIKRGNIRDVIDEVLTITSEFVTISEFQSIYFAHNLVYNLFQLSNCNEPHLGDFLCYNSKILQIYHNDSSVENETEHENTDNRSDFAGQIAVQVNEWLSSIIGIEKVNSSSRLVVVDDLTGDIVDRQKYLESYPSLPNSEDEELENLRYQIFKWVNKVLGEDNTDTLAKAPDLLTRIKSIRVTQTSQEEITVMPKPTYHSSNVPNEQRRNSRPDGQPNRSSIRPSVSRSSTVPSANAPVEQRRDSRPDGQPNRSSIRPSVLQSATVPSANAPDEQRRDSRPDGQPNRSSIRPSVLQSATVPSANAPDEQRRDSRPDGQPNRSSIRPSVLQSATVPSANAPDEQRRDSRPDGQPNRSSIRPSVLQSATVPSANAPDEQRRDSRPDGQPNRSSIRPSVLQSATVPSANALDEQRRDSRLDGQPNRSSIRPSVLQSATVPSANAPDEQRRDSRPDGQPNRSSIRPSVSRSATVPSANVPNEQRRDSRPDGQPNRSSIRPSVLQSATVPSANAPDEQRRDSRLDGQPNRSSIRPSVSRSATVPSTAQNNSIKQLNEEYDAYVKDWVQRVPIAVAKPKDEEIAEKARLGLYIGVWKAITKLKMSPEILDNPYHYQDALDDELEILLQCLPQTQEFKTIKHVLKPELIEKTMIFNERVANVAGCCSYRQQLVNNVNNSLPKQTEINTAGKNADLLYEEWEKNVLAEYYILYNRFKIDDRVKAIAYKKKLMRHIEKMIDNIKATTKQELKELDYHTYEDEILTALDEVPIPSDETLNEEAGEILILLEVEQWFRDLPLLPSKKESSILQVKVFQDLLARKLYDIDAHCNPTKRTDLMKQEIRRFLERLPLREEEKPNMNFMIEELLNRLNNVNSDVVVVGGENERKPNWNFLEGYDYDAFSRNLPVSSTFEGNPPRDPYDGSSYLISEGARVPDEQGWQMIRDPTGISEQYLTIEGLTGPRIPSAPPTPQNGGVPPSNQFLTPSQGFRTEQTMNNSCPGSGNATRNDQASSQSIQRVEDPISNLRNQSQSGYGSLAGGYDPNRLQPPPVDINKTAMPQQYRTSPMPDCCGLPTPQDNERYSTPRQQVNGAYTMPRPQHVDCSGMPLPQDYGTSAMPRPLESGTSGMPTPQDNGAYGMSRPQSSSTPQELRNSGTYPMQKPQQSGTSAMPTSQDYRPSLTPRPQQTGANVLPTPQDYRASAMPRPQENRANSMSRPQYGTSPMPSSLPPSCCATPRYGASDIPMPQEQRASVSFRPIDNGSFGVPSPQNSNTPQDLRTTEQGTNPIPRTLDSGTTPVGYNTVRRSSAPPSYRPSRSQYQNNVPPTPDPYTPYSTQDNETPQTPRKCRKDRRDSARRKLSFAETENDSDTDFSCRCMEKIWRCRRKPVCEMRGYIPCEELPCFMRMREPCYYR